MPYLICYYHSFLKCKYASITEQTERWSHKGTAGVDQLWNCPLTIYSKWCFFCDHLELIPIKNKKWSSSYHLRLLHIKDTSKTFRTPALEAWISLPLVYIMDIDIKWFYCLANLSLLTHKHTKGIIPDADASCLSFSNERHDASAYQTCFVCHWGTDVFDYIQNWFVDMDVLLCL